MATIQGLSLPVDMSVAYTNGGSFPFLPTSTSIIYADPSGDTLYIAGTGFSYDSAGNPNGGTISGINVFEGESGPTIVTFTGLSVPLTTLWNFLQANNWAGFVALAAEGADSINGSTSGDWLNGHAGSDTINGYAGNDTLNGGSGNDSIMGGDGNDTIIVTHDDGVDILSGGAGFDLLDFSAVNGVIQINQLGGVTTGSAGNDVILDVFEQVQGTNFDDVLSGGHGGDVLDGGGGNDQFFGNNGDDLMRGGSGDDTFFFSNSDGDDRLLGGPGFDILDYSPLSGPVQVNQLAGTTTGTAGNDTLLDIFEMVIGTSFGDVLSGGHGSNSLKGGGGDDQIFANNGDDYISGGTGNDRITMGPGNDTLDFRNGENVDTITDFVAGAGSDDTITLKFYSGLGTTTLAGLVGAGRINQNGANTEVTLNGGDMVILENVLVGSLHNDDFVFV